MKTIGQVVNEFNVSHHTLRYYEKEQILLSERSASGERCYTEEQIKWLQFVLKLRETQMPLAIIRRYAELVLEGEDTAFERLELLESHQKFIQNQISLLTSVNEMLTYKVQTYRTMISPSKEPDEFN